MGDPTFGMTMLCALSLLALPLSASVPAGDAPTANAGARVTGAPGEVSLFDASASTGGGLRYAWTLLDGPASADLLHADDEAALLVPSAKRGHRLGVEVCDRWGRCDGSETVAFVDEVEKRAGAGSFGSKKPWSENQAPEAEATSRRRLGLLGTVKLNGSGSSDPNGGALRFRWQLISRPAGSVLGDADIIGGTTATASFMPDVSGPYAFTLTVRDVVRGDSVTLPEMTLGVLHDTDPID